MNKVILMGRLTKDPETRYSQASEPMAISRYNLAVRKRFHREGEAEADFIPCVAFGKNGEFAEKYYKKGQQVAIIGRLQVRNWEDKEGHKRITTEVVVEEQYFAESKQQKKTENSAIENEGFYPIDEGNITDDDLPF